MRPCPSEQAVELSKIFTGMNTTSIAGDVTFQMVIHSCAVVLSLYETLNRKSERFWVIIEEYVEH